MIKIAKSILSGCCKSKLINTIIICIFLIACNPKTGNKRVEFSLKSDEPITMENVSETTNIIKNRLINYGIPEKNIQFKVQDNIIQIDIEHADDPDRILFLCTTSGNIGFWETFELSEIFEYLQKVNYQAIELMDSINKIENNDKKNIKNKKLMELDTSSILYKIEKNKIDEPDSYENFTKENPLFAFLQLSTKQPKEGEIQIVPSLGEVTNPEIENQSYFIEGPVVGSCKIADTSRVNEILSLGINEFFPNNLKFLWSIPNIDTDKKYLNLIAIKIATRSGEAQLDGSVIVDSHPEKGEDGGYNISLSMNAEGAITWSRLTKENTGRYIAIVMDNYVYSYLKVMDEIKDGSSIISANLTKDEAEALASILKFPGFPVKMKVLKSKITDEPKK